MSFAVSVCNFLARRLKYTYHHHHHFLEDENFDKNPKTRDESKIRTKGDFHISALPRNPIERQFVTYCAGKKGYVILGL